MDIEPGREEPANSKTSVSIFKISSICFLKSFKNELIIAPLSLQSIRFPNALSKELRIPISFRTFRRFDACPLLEAAVPVAYGVITAETLDQAIERSGTKAGNKGFDAALSALEMIDLWTAIDAG